MEKQEIREIIQAYLAGTCTEEERRIVERHFIQYLDQSDAQPTKEQIVRSFETTYKRLLPNIQGARTAIKNPLLIRWLPYAAAVLFLIGVFCILLFQDAPSSTLKQASKEDKITPGSNRAMLSIDGGETIALREDQSGIVMNGDQISYADGSQIDSDPDNSSGKEYSLQTPKGGTYQLCLPDGTKVWLNAASSIHYPTTFGKDEIRSIRLEGEAYFEVAKDKDHPFVVTTGSGNIEVLGTHFNVNAYPDENSGRTTLLEGSVRINGDAILTPGEQAIVDKNGKIRVRPVDTERIVAWKNGKFVFDSEHLESVMQKISRWYNVEISYQGSVSGKTFSGTVSRFEDIHQLLHMITYTSGVQFDLTERRITVMP